MLVEASKGAETIGSLKIYYPQRIIKLESRTPSSSIYDFPRESLDDILKDFSIIVPIKNEKIQLFDSLIRSIPSNCPIIVVSNSDRKKYKEEVKVIRRFYETTGHPIIFAHQKDPRIGSALQDIGYRKILENGRIRDGKGEGMILGLLVAKYLKSRYVGFVDADNYISSSIYEYILDFAVGIAMSNTPYSMVRLLWRYKPKAVGDRLHLEKWGRVSRVTNKYMNLLLSSQLGTETRILKTGNAGEHAMSMKLAEKLSYSSGYSFEPYQLVHLLEKFTDTREEGVEVFQIETLSPHMHENKGEKHVQDMLLSSLSTIYHSRIANKHLKSKIIDELKKRGLLRGEEPPGNIIMPPIEDINVRSFIKMVKNSKSFMKLG